MLRMEQKPSFNRSFDENKKLPKNYTPSAKEAAYEKLNFPDNMDY